MRRLCSDQTEPDNSLPSAATGGNGGVRRGFWDKISQNDYQAVIAHVCFIWICLFQHPANRDKLYHLHASRISSQSKSLITLIIWTDKGRILSAISILSSN